MASTSRYGLLKWVVLVLVVVIVLACQALFGGSTFENSSIQPVSSHVSFLAAYGDVLPPSASLAFEPGPEDCVPVDAKRKNISFRVVDIDVKGSTPFRMAVNANVHGRDIVSSKITSSKVWEKGLTDRIMRELSDAAAAAGTVGSTFIDIGANIGWFSLVAAAAGHRVFAFEPFVKNAELIQISLCLNPHIKRNMILVNSGLHETSTTCQLWSNNNIGNTHTACGRTPEELATTEESMVKSGLYKVSVVEMRSLDDFLLELPPLSAPLGSLKIDVEGFEPTIMRGAKQLLTSPNAPVALHTEFHQDMISQTALEEDQRALKYLEFMLAAGYTTIQDGEDGLLDVSDLPGAVKKMHRWGHELHLSKKR